LAAVIIRIAKGIAVFLSFIRPHNPFEHDVRITCGAGPYFDIPKDSQIITEIISEDLV
jgi:hypothetical protein